MQRDQPPHCGNHTSRQPLPSVQQQAGFAKPHQLLVFLSIVLGIGFFATSVASFYASKASIRDSIVNNELPLTTDNIYSEIQKDLVRPVFISAMMASDTFLHDWVLAGEKNPAAVHKYLHDVQDKSSAFTSFFVSDKTLRYYYGNGNRKTLFPDNPDDDWYFKVRQLKLMYELNVDHDRKLSNNLIVFVNHRMFDYAGQYIGVTGVGITVGDVQALIGNYQARYQRNVYFIDKHGRIVLSGDRDKPLGSQITEIDGLNQIADKLTQQDNATYQYQKAHTNYLVNVRYIPELKWYLVVEKNEADATASIRHTLYLNLAICLIITCFVLLLTHLAIRRYQRKIERLSTIDLLTGLPNRSAFEVVMPNMAQDSLRQRTPLSLLLTDIDFFKAVNDNYGHLAGDAALRTVANVLKNHLRGSDFVCRWGGEEFLIVLKGCDADAAHQVAENIRRAIENSLTVHQQHNIKLTMSFGSATRHADEDFEQWIARADHQLYCAKRAGRNHVRSADAVDPEL